MLFTFTLTICRYFKFTGTYYKFIDLNCAWMYLDDEEKDAVYTRFLNGYASNILVSSFETGEQNKNRHCHGIFNGTSEEYSDFQHYFFTSFKMKSQTFDNHKHMLVEGHELTTTKDVLSWLMYVLKDQDLKDLPDCFYRCIWPLQALGEPDGSP